MSNQLRPRITLGKTEHHQLLVLAMSASGHPASASDELHHELERAHTMPDSRLPADVVRMGATVTYRPEGGSDRTVTLVYPAQADISAGRISILTPIGTALIGLRIGQTISWQSRDGQFRKLTLISVTPPAAESAGQNEGLDATG